MCYLNLLYNVCAAKIGALKLMLIIIIIIITFITTLLTSKNIVTCMTHTGAKIKTIYNNLKMIVIY